MKLIKIIVTVCICVLSGHLGFSQERHTLSYTEETPPVKASLTDVSWIQGHWRGEAFGGIAEEIWSPPLGDSMMCAFKLVSDNKVQFYELCVIREVNGTLLLQLKHFHRDFKGWEKKDETVDFKLVSLEPGKVFFDKFTFEKISKNEMNLYVVIKNDKGAEEEVKFNYKRFQQ